MAMQTMRQVAQTKTICPHVCSHGALEEGTYPCVTQYWTYPDIMRLHERSISKRCQCVLRPCFQTDAARIINCQTSNLRLKGRRH